MSKHWTTTQCPPAFTQTSANASKDALRTVRDTAISGEPAEYSSPSTCNADVGLRFPCPKPVNGRRVRCDAHIGKPGIKLTLHDLPQRAVNESSCGNLGTIGARGFIHADVIKNSYNEVCPVDCDHTDYCRESELVDMKTGGYSPTAHAAAMGDTRLVKDKESFLFATYVYATHNFNISDFDGDTVKGWYGEEFRIQSPHEDKNLILKLHDLPTEQRLSWVGGQLGVNMEEASLQEFDINDLSLLLINNYGSYDIPIFGEFDVELSVPLAVVSNTSEGPEILFGERALRQARRIQEHNVSNDVQWPVQPTSFLLYVV